MVASRSPYSVRGMELTKGVMTYWKIKMAGGKTAVNKSWSEQELKAFVSVLALNENRD